MQKLPPKIRKMFSMILTRSGCEIFLQYESESLEHTVRNIASVETGNPFYKNTAFREKLMSKAIQIDKHESQRSSQ